jgi:hypothetical protein
MTTTTLPPEASLPPDLQNAIAEYDAWSYQYLKKEQERTVVDAPLYQYTDVNGLRGIFDSRQMWFTDYRFLNDPSEFSHGMETAKRMLSHAKTGADENVCWFLDHVAETYSHGNVSATLAFFVASFSCASDDLGQWRSYADGGRGFAVGFAPMMFSVQDAPNQSPDENAFCGPVLYKEAEVQERHRLAVEKAIESIRSASKADAKAMRNSAISRPFMRDLAKRLMAAPLIWNAVTSKHPAYEREREVRLVMTGPWEKLGPYVKTRSRGSDLIPYIHYPWDVHKPGAVAEILVGPAAPPGAEEAVRLLIAGYGATGIEIRRSDIPYRAT